MREKFLLAVGILLILFGITGVVGVASAYYYVKPYLDDLPRNLENVFSAAEKTINDAGIAVREGTSMLKVAADNLDSKSQGMQLFRDLAISLRSLVPIMENLDSDAQIHSSQIEATRKLVLGQIGQSRLVFDLLFIWLTLLHSLLIVTGVAFISIRRRMLECVQLTDVVRKRDGETKAVGTEELAEKQMAYQNASEEKVKETVKMPEKGQTREYPGSSPAK